MVDLTDRDFFTSFIGSFWTRIFSDAGFVNGVSSASVSEIAQSYQSLVEAIQRLSIDSIKGESIKLLYPIVFRRSNFSEGPDKLKYGGGEVFGPQPEVGEFRGGVTFVYGGLERRSGNFYIGLDNAVVDIGSSIINGLVNPSVVMTRGIDFTFKDGIVTFKDDPFLNPLISQRHIFSDSLGEDDEIVLWTSGAKLNKGEFDDQFGFASVGIASDSPSYLEITKSSLKVISGGPSLSLIDHFVAALLGLPCIRSNQETVLSISSFSGYQIVATDLEIYKINPALELRVEISPGEVLEFGHPLTTGSLIFDPKSNPSWWSSIDGLVLSETFFNVNFSSALGFVNVNSLVELSAPEKSTDGQEWRSAKFFIAGRKQDVDLFWEKSREFGLKNGTTSGNLIYKYLGIVDEDGEADFSRSAIINPLGFMAENIFNSGSIVIRVKSESVASLEDFFRGAEILKKVTPPHLGLIIILDISINDEVLFQRIDGLGVEPTELDLSSTFDVIRGRVEEFPSEVEDLWTLVDDDGVVLTMCPEALSLDYSPTDHFRETISFEAAADNLTSYGVSTKVCDEFIESANIKICKP